VSMLVTTRRLPVHPGAADGPPPVFALAAAVLGFFVITLDAVVVNVALPSIRQNLAAGMTGLQWVVDAYTLMFAALLLSSGALTDRVGARRAFGGGLAVFVAASVACGLAPSLAALVAARLVQAPWRCGRWAAQSPLPPAPWWAGCSRWRRGG